MGHWVVSEEEHPCRSCAGTGEKFDHEKDDWTSPIEPCEKCKGSGYSLYPTDVYVEDDSDYGRSSE